MYHFAVLSTQLRQRAQTGYGPHSLECQVQQQGHADC